MKLFWKLAIPFFMAMVGSKDGHYAAGSYWMVPPDLY
jgi:hypothetical protein